MRDRIDARHEATKNHHWNLGVALAAVLIAATGIGISAWFGWAASKEQANATRDATNRQLQFQEKLITNQFPVFKVPRRNDNAQRKP